MDEQTKQKLVSELREHLDALPETTGDSAPSTGEAQARVVDLYSLFTELAGLRNEVRLESRQLKRSLDEFNDVFSTLQDSNKRLGNELDGQREDRTAAVADAERALLLELIDLRDRLVPARDMAASHQPGALERWFAKRPNALVQDMAEGLSITLRRLDQALARHDVTPIQALGQSIDPHRMRVSSVQTDGTQADGIVLEEVRRGYQRGDQILRLAEVIANKRDTE